MSCPKCNGFVTYDSDVLAVKRTLDGAWLYFNCRCEDCGATGIGRQWFEEITEDYEDFVDLPEEEDANIILR